MNPQRCVRAILKRVAWSRLATLSMAGCVLTALMPGPSQVAHAASTLPGLHVVGSNLTDDAGNVVRLRGVNGAAANDLCYQQPQAPLLATGSGQPGDPFDGPTD